VVIAASLFYIGGSTIKSKQCPSCQIYNVFQLSTENDLYGWWKCVYPKCGYARQINKVTGRMIYENKKPKELSKAKKDKRNVVNAQRAN